MMGRIFTLLVACVLLLFSLVSCGEITPPPPADYTVEIVTEYRTENGNSVQLMYPAITGLVDRAAETKVNTLLADYAYDMYLQDERTASGGYTYAVTEAEITLAAKGFLSGYIGGVITADETGYAAYFAYTFNCDIVNCTLYRTEDLITDYSRLKKLFLADRFSQHFGYPDLKTQVSLDDMISQYKTEYGIFPQVYFTGDSVGVLLEVIPLLDGYAGYTLPVRQAKKCLNNENPLIALFMGEN